MSFNKVPLIITASGAVLLTLVQQYIRPKLARAGIHSIMLGSAPNLIVGFCFPFSALIRPRAFTKKGARKFFYLMCAASLTLLLFFEFYRPIAGAQTFDVFDILASIAGVGSAFLFQRLWLESRLSYGTE